MPLDRRARALGRVDERGIGGVEVADGEVDSKSQRAGALQPRIGRDDERVGEYQVRGFNDPIELFAYNG